jgi:hypothetical protein
LPFTATRDHGIVGHSVGRTIRILRLQSGNPRIPTIRAKENKKQRKIEKKEKKKEKKIPEPFRLITFSLPKPSDSEPQETASSKLFENQSKIGNLFPLKR